MRKRSWSFLLLHYWGKFIGLNPFVLPKTNELEFSYFCFLYNCFLSVVNCYSVYCIIFGRIGMQFPGDSPAGKVVDLIGIGSGFFENTFMWLSFGFRGSSVKLMVESFMKAQKIFKKLGIQKNSEEYLRQLALYLTLVNGLYTIWMTFNFITTNHFHNIGIVIWVCYCIFRMCSYNMLTLFLWSFICVKKNFHDINNEVRSFLQVHCREVSELGNQVSRRLMRSSSRKFIDPSAKIKIISQLHHQLRDVVSRIQDYFSAFVVFNIVGLLTQISNDVYAIYRYREVRSGPITPSDLMFFTHVSFWILVPLLVLHLISNVCSSLSEEANETGNILHAMLCDRQNSNNTSTTAQFQLLLLDLLKNRVKILLLGCVDLDSFFVYNIIATAATYLTIMLQFYN